MVVDSGGKWALVMVLTPIESLLELRLVVFTTREGVGNAGAWAGGVVDWG